MPTVDLKSLIELAIKGRLFSHSPYSGYKIGAAIRMSDGKIFTGCNVENASYGATICAERTAILKAISEGAAHQITDVVVVSDEENPWPPCGMCRQMIAEFASENTMIHLTNLNGNLTTVPFAQLFPSSFNPTHLK
jgi:cytidine deaminase